MPARFRPKCPDCGSTLEKGKKSGYYCPNAECSVIKVHFNRNLGASRIVREGPQAFALAAMKKRIDRSIEFWFRFAIPVCV